MMQIEARDAIVRTSDSYDAPPPRDRMPTIPQDLSEYAWIHTGPPSWGEERSAETDELDARRHARIDDVTSGLLLDLWHSDVPIIVGCDEVVVDEREARILSLADGRATIGMLLELSDLALPDVLGAICELCARGVLSLDRSRRPDARASAHV